MHNNKLEITLKWTLTKRRLQYKTLMSTSIGALQRDRRFLARKSRADKVTSANRPRKKVTVERLNPMTVRYWKCQPYASLLVQDQYVVCLRKLYATYARLGFSCILQKSAICPPGDNMDMIQTYNLKDQRKLARPANWEQTRESAMEQTPETPQYSTYMDHGGEAAGGTGQALQGMVQIARHCSIPIYIYNVCTVKVDVRLYSE